VIELSPADIAALARAFDWFDALEPKPGAIASLRRPKSGALHFLDAKDGKLPILPSGASLILRSGAERPADVLVVEVAEPKVVFAAMTRTLRAARRADDVAITSSGAFVSASAEIAPGCMIEAGAHIGARVRIGPDTLVESGAVLRAGVALGARCRVLANAVVGSDGFGYSFPPDSWPEPIAHLGGVEIGDDVDIGPAAVVSAGTIDPTVIGAGTKIEGHAYIGHNAQLGRGVMVCAHAVVGGSAAVGDRVWVNPGALIRTKVRIGERATVGMGAVVMKPVAPDTTVMGDTAGEIRERLRLQVALERLADARSR
jgi:UDP-3-O-[3-hydroxymyristoyl] glucosamine N-acyltransferase